MSGKTSYNKHILLSKLCFGREKCWLAFMVMRYISMKCETFIWRKDEFDIRLEWHFKYVGGNIYYTLCFDLLHLTACGGLVDAALSLLNFSNWYMLLSRVKHLNMYTLIWQQILRIPDVNLIIITHFYAAALFRSYVYCCWQRTSFAFIFVSIFTIQHIV